MKPAIRHLGHAGFQVNGDHGSLVIDPWFNPAMLDSWFPWPDNSRLRDCVFGNWLYVSHHHEDHFDAGFLRGYLANFPDQRIIVPRFRSRRMERLWKSVGARPGQTHVLGHGDQLELAEGVTVTMLLDRSHKEDSALLLDHHGYRFLDMNDCELALSDIPRCDELAAQFSGAFWYPQCYGYPYADYLLKAVRVKKSNVERLYRKMERSQAMTYRPSAGPAAFLDSSLRRFNAGEDYGVIFPEWADVQRKFLRRFPRVRIGGYLPVAESVENCAARREDDWSRFYERDNTPATAEEVDRHFRLLCRDNRRLLEGYAKDIVFSSAHDEWKIRVGALKGELEEPFNPAYWVHAPRRVMRAVLNGDCDWETALLTMRCTLSREPDEYDFTLMSLLGFGAEPAVTTEIARARDQPPSERVVSGGFEFSRWCPHAGEDLTFATVENRVITCPRHGWAWSADTGECVLGSGSSIPIHACPVPGWLPPR